MQDLKNEFIKGRIEILSVLIHDSYYQGFVDRGKEQFLTHKEGIAQNKRINEITNQMIPGLIGMAGKYKFQFKDDRNEYIVEAGNLNDAKDVLCVLLGKEKATIEDMVAGMKIKIFTE